MVINSIWLSACSVCTWQLLPMLSVSWLLGWLFWSIYKGANYQQEIIELKSKIIGQKTIEASLKNEIGNINYEKEKIYSDYLDTRDAFMALELQFINLNEEKEELEIAIADSTHPQIPKAEYDLLKSRFVKLEGELKQTKRSVKIGSDHHDLERLKQQLQKAEEEIEELRNQKREVIEKVIYMEKNKPGQAPQANVAPPVEWEDDHVPAGPSENNGGRPRGNGDEHYVEEEIYEDDQTDLYSDDTHLPPIPESLYDYHQLFLKDNFQIIEGIGPRIEELIKADGIQNWVELAACDHNRLLRILTQAGPRYKVHDPESWSRQASFAVNGNWSGLVKYQRFLSSKKDLSKKKNSGFAKIEKLANKILEQNKELQDDLKIIEGIGKKTEKLLYDSGIHTWKSLAAFKPAALEKILREEFSNPEELDLANWIEQAKLAAEGNWDLLAKLQENLTKK